ncbi:MAG: branched-chain amino acid ABC transporter permease [Proteobacteria bacterium]|nr:branched-chain amino acid ABC transporter permease [Pseudomonadota bacterium]
MSESRTVASLLLAAVAGLALFPFMSGEFYLELFTHLMVLGIFAMSLDLLIGYTGLVSFGHAAFFGLAGYLLAIITPESEAMSLWVSLPVCLAGVALAALVIGWFSVRTSGVYFIMITLAFAQMAFYYFNENVALGGSDGMFIFTKPSVGVGGFEIIDLGDPTTVYYAVLASLVACYLLLSMVLRAPFGRVIKAIRVNEHRTRALGYDTRRYKLAAFVIAGTMAGYAGYLEAVSTGIVSPGHLSWHQSGLVLILVILGGMGTLYGPVLGAFVLGLLHDQVQDVTVHWQLVQGIFVILVVLFLPHGIAGLVARLARRDAALAERAGEPES